MYNKKLRNLTVIIFPLQKGSVVPLSNFLKIIDPFYDNIFVIAGAVEACDLEYNNKKLHRINVVHISGTNVFTRIFNYVHTQIKLGKIIYKDITNSNLYVFHLGGENLSIPLIIVKLMGKKSLLIFGGYSGIISQACNDRFSYLQNLIIRVNLNIFDNILIYSEKVISNWAIEDGLLNKIIICINHLVDFNKFFKAKNLDKRQYSIGYIGRLSQEKGCLNFVESIPLLINKHRLKVVIGGEGPLRDKIEKYICMNHLEATIDFTGWVPHNALNECLNDIRLLVVPSYTEGLPNIILESMACGTPVLATPVGAIPDIIKDGETGFLMESNSSDCIAANIVRALEHPDLESIAQHARDLVESEFTFERAVERWRKVLEEVDDDGR